MNPTEPKPAILKADAKPPHGLDPEGQRFWRGLLPLVRGMGVATVADEIGLMMACSALSEFVRARAVVQQFGPTLIRGGPLSHAT